MANIFGMKHDIDNRAKALERTKRLLHRLKISWTLVQKRVKIRPKISPTLRKFCVSCFFVRRCTRQTEPNQTCAKWEEVNGADASRLRWRHIVNVNETIKIRSLVFRAPKHFKLAFLRLCFIPKIYHVSFRRYSPFSGRRRIRRVVKNEGPIFLAVCVLKFIKFWDSVGDYL